MNLKYDESLSDFAFNFNLRRYSAVGLNCGGRPPFVDKIKVGRCKLKPWKPVLKAPQTKHLKLKYETRQLLSFFACIFNLRRYNKVRRCRLTPG